MIRAPFTRSEYRQAFEILGDHVSKKQRRMLSAHAQAPGRVLNVVELAQAAGSSSPEFTYSQYGRLGHSIAEALSSRRRERIWTRIIAADSRSQANGLVEWLLYQEVCEAIADLRWNTAFLRPDPLSDIEAATSELVGLTEPTRQALVEARLGQGPFRAVTMQRWGSCSVTGCSVLEALHASHIKSWRDSTNTERLDPDNGLLLLATLHALFDAGLISFSEQGALLVAARVPKAKWPELGLKPQMRLRKQFAGSRRYLSWHRRKIFIDGARRLGVDE